MHEASLSKPSSSDTVAPSRQWIAWAAVAVGVLVVKIGAQANTPAARAAQDLRWAITPAVLALVDLLALFAALRLSKRYPLGPAQSWRHVGPHAIAALAYGALHFAVDTWIEPGLDPAAAANQDTWLVRLGWDTLAYAIYTGVAHGVEYVRRYRASKASALRAQSELADTERRSAEAELRALKAELNPRLISNALGAVSSLVHSDRDAARRVLAQLGDILRAAVLRGGAIEVTLAEEIDGLEPFLAIERARHGDRLAVRWDIDEATLDARLPHMTLQPLLSHVAHSALAHHASAGVRISAARGGARADQLRLEIRSDDAGAHAAAPDSNGSSMAMANVRTRVEELYGAAASFESAGTDGSGIRLTLPWRDDDVADDIANERLGAVGTPTESRRGARSLALPLLLAAWFGLVLAAAAMRAFQAPLSNGLRAPLGGALAEGLLAALLTTSMLYVAIRLTSRATSTWRAHVVAAVGLGAANSVGKALLVAILGAPYPPIPAGRLVAAVVVGAFLYGILLAIVRAVAYARRDRGNEVTTLRLQTEMAIVAQRRAKAELRSLKAQINPHFLGNALSMVSTLLHSDPAAAEQVIGQLNSMLEAATSRLDTQEVTLEEEIDGLAPFIALERARFGDRLTVRWDVDEAALGARVPHMILQPLMENAVKHGFSQRNGVGVIVVAGHRNGRQLELDVRDDGVGLVAAAGAAQGWQTGVGLANARTRLAELYGGDASLDLVGGAGSGTVARLTLPWRDSGALS